MKSVALIESRDGMWYVVCLHREVLYVILQDYLDNVTFQY